MSLEETLDQIDKQTIRTMSPNGTFYKFQVIDAVKKWLDANISCTCEDAESPDTMCDYCFLHSQIYKSTDEAKEAKPE